MSFQDLLRDMEAGVLQQAAPPAQEVARGVFQLNTKVDALRYMADALGTPRDTPSLRGRLRSTRAGIKRLATSTSQALRQAATAAAASSGDDESVASCSKLAMDFEAAVNEYQKIERRIAAVERQETAAAAHRSPSPPSPPPSFNHRNSNGDQRFSEQKQTQLAVLQVQTQQRDITLLGNEIELQEAIIAEREKGILEVQQEIADIHEIFKDLAVLVHDQGECIEIVTTNIDRAEAATSQAEVQISKAAGIREEEKEKEKLLTGAGSEDNSSTKCLLLAVLGLFLFIVGLVFIA